MNKFRKLKNNVQIADNAEFCEMDNRNKSITIICIEVNTKTKRI